MGSVEMPPPWRYDEDAGDSSTLELKLKQVWLQTQLQKASSSSSSSSSSNCPKCEAPDLESILMNDDDLSSLKNGDNSSLRILQSDDSDNEQDDACENQGITGLCKQLSTHQVTCSFSTNVVEFDNEEVADPIEQQQGAWMIESPFGLEWPKLEKPGTCGGTGRVCQGGVSTQRLVHYFVEALVARMSATGNGIFTAMLYAKTRAAVMLKSVEFVMERSPLLNVRYFFPNQVILDVCRGHPRIHIVDYGAEFGFQWPSLMQELVKIRPQPQLRITGIDSPLAGAPCIAEEVGCMLREYASSIGLPFKFRAVSMKWENIGPEVLLLKDDEALVVNCMFRQTNLLDESVLAESPRKMWLSRVRSLNPKVFIQGMNNASYNVPFFMTRFLEALTHYAIFFDVIDNCAAPDSVERHTVEQEKLCREIVNVVACEGLERVQRAETYKQWHSRTQRASFELLPIVPSLYKDTESLMSLYHHDFCLQKDEGWLLLGWKGQILHAFSAWAPF